MTRIAILLCGVTALAGETLPPALKAIVDAERAFARASVEHGQREAFLSYLADDGVTFSPGPGRGAEGIRKRPSPHPSSVLNWTPKLGAVSNSGDLGFTLGPYVVSDTTGVKPMRHGTYFTVWRRQPGGRYLVDLDAGVSSQAENPPLERVRFTAIENIGAHPPERPLPASDLLSRADGQYNEAIRKLGAAVAARSVHRNDARLLIDGLGELAAVPEIDRWLKEHGASYRPSDTAGVRFSQARDLGYTFGKYDGKDAAARGYYVRLWTREPRQSWKVLVEMLLPLPLG